MVTTHAYPNSREAILPIWSGEGLARRQAPDASLTSLFVHTPGMLFTKIQLDDVKPILARFSSKLLIEGELWSHLHIIKHSAPPVFAAPLVCSVTH